MLLVIDHSGAQTGRHRTTGGRRMPGVPAATPVAGFCADLRRRWRASGRDLPSVARDVRISRTQLYAILGGEI